MTQPVEINPGVMLDHIKQENDFLRQRAMLLGQNVFLLRQKVQMLEAALASAGVDPALTGPDAAEIVQ